MASKQLALSNYLIFIAAIFLAVVNFGFKDPENKNRITLQIENIDCATGCVMVAAYDKEANFLTDRVFYRTHARVDGKKSQILSIELPTGKYAFAVFQDLNDDKILNKNILGIPKEPYGFSGEPITRFGPPTWNETAVLIEKDERIRISIN